MEGADRWHPGGTGGESQAAGMSWSQVFYLGSEREICCKPEAPHTPALPRPYSSGGVCRGWRGAEVFPPATSPSCSSPPGCCALGCATLISRPCTRQQPVGQQKYSAGESCEGSLSYSLPGLALKIVQAAFVTLIKGKKKKKKDPAFSWDYSPRRSAPLASASLAYKSKSP